MSPDTPPDRAHFGRRKGHSLRPAQAERFQSLLPRLALDLTREPPAALGSLFPSRPRDVHLEIGFGGAEHLIHQATMARDIGFIGCEAFQDGIAKALAGIDRGGLENIRLHFGDAIDLLRWLPSGSIARIYLLYPDPWPKRRHWKRRFVSPERLDDLARVLRAGGELRFASDIGSNLTWTLCHTMRHPAFRWRADRPADWLQPWPDWLSTRYEQKARREGRRSAYLTFQRN